MKLYRSRALQSVRVTVLLVAGCTIIGTEAKAQTAALRINASVPGVSGPVAVRAVIRQSDGSFYPGEWGNSSWPNVALRGKAVGPNTTLQVKAGTTIITVGKGPDYLPQTLTANLVNGQTTTLNVALQPVLNMRGNGWVAGDIHTHYNHGEGQIFRTPQQIHNMAGAGGLNFVSLCQEHYGATTLTRGEMLDVWAQFDHTECQVWVGAEEPKNAWGHHASIVYDPWRIRSPLPYYTGIHEVHRQGGVAIPVHPLRKFPGKFDGQSWGLYPMNNFYKAYPLQALSGKLIDGWGGLSDEPHHPTTLPPYFELLNMGYRIPFMADSDTAFDRLNNGAKAPGHWINYFQLDGQPLNKASVVEAIKNGKVISTTGPLLTFAIDGAKPGDTLAPDGTTRTVQIRASYSFNPWTLGRNSFTGEPCRIAQIDLFRNGQVIQTWNPNTPEANIDFPINETSAGSYYMVRVLGNDAAWMAGYASPIYFDHAPRPRQPRGFTPLVNGRVYDAANNAPVQATVNCIRDGETLWSLETDSQGLFRAYVPLDARLVARDSNGRQLSRDILNDERVYAFCHDLPDNYPNLVGSIAPFRELVREIKWEFPLGRQNAASYVRQPLSGNGQMSNFTIQSAPAPTPGKDSTEITTLIVDKTRVQPGDTINYAILFRTPYGGAPNEELSIEWKGWDPQYPRLYTKHGRLFDHNNGANTLVSLGNGFYLRQGSTVVPSWIGNVNDSSPGLKMAVTARGRVSEEANLLIPVGPTRTELLVSSTWDGFPATWGEFGVGPCYFHRQLTANIRYNDYRRLQFSLQINGQTISIHPIADTARTPDADDALFDDYFFYDGQLGPQYRNINYRDPVRTQPAEPNFASVAIFNPQDQNQAGGGGGGGLPPPQTTTLPIANEWFGPSMGNEKVVFWEHSGGQTAATILSLTNFTYATFLRDGRAAGPGWRARAVADMNRDGLPDLLWKHANGRSAVWFMHGTEFISAMSLRNGHALPPGWDMAGSGDLNGDSHADIVWQHTDGRLAGWLMNGPQFGSTISIRDGLPVPSSWRFSGVTDLDGNGSGDILWHNANNKFASWQLHQGTFGGSIVLRSVNSAWKLVGTPDLNGDGRDDFLWQNVDGRLAVWFMNGPTYQGATLLIQGNPARAGWRVIGAK